jgi:hypothetical protein
LASRASAYLFVACGEADFFSAFVLVSGTALGSELTTGVVLIIFSPSNFFFYRNVHPLTLVDLRLFNSVQSFIWRTDKVAGQKAHSRHVVFTGVSTLVTGPGRLAVPGDWERITLLTVSAFGDGPGA